MRDAQTLTVASRSKALFLAGDNQVNNAAIFAEVVDELLADYRDHTKPSWLAPVKVFVQNQSYNFNVKGALYAAELFKSA